jgi:hypothetical protein
MSMKLFLTVALSLMMIALIAHAQQFPPGYPPPPPGYPPPSYYPPPPPPPEMAPPAYAPQPRATEMIPPPPSYSPQQAVTPALPPTQNQAPAQSLAPPALQAQQQGNITFVSGGAGDDDRDALKQVENQYNLRLMFAARSGEYLANVAVTLADSRGNTVLDTIADGPIFYAHVPPGRYRLTVASQGQSQGRDVTVAANGAVHQDFYWASAS